MECSMGEKSSGKQEGVGLSTELQTRHQLSDPLHPAPIH